MKITDSWCRNFDFDSMCGYDGDDDHLIPFNCFDSARLGAGPTRCCTDTVMAGAFCLTACETYILILRGVKGQSLCSGCAENRENLLPPNHYGRFSLYEDYSACIDRMRNTRI